MKSIFSIFVSLSEQAMVGCSLNDLKILNYLPVQSSVRISAKAHKPYHSAYRSRQASNVFDYLKFNKKSDMTTQRANGAMGEALTRPSFNFKSVIGSGQSRYAREGLFNSLFVGAFSLSFLSFVLVIASVLFSLFSFSFKPVHPLIVQ